ncbi:rSAM/selenodomain-associated transferase 2 [Ulvibacter sp. MAR_2010_11]|uniref:TIGR04283 family arsenosugar biosynthesis glycosyltransferase n=1 Tax=Ulvibacter sp. MAR_2010_11 TaxID=1250229 RepID=UPI000C2C1422|nr:TIGR04283 family arsenosugar biosynthesis glycosyltransferase [Ulvibacter sp. MAR_2010_11]PKA82534.1 rSAM/selenodomain-associated transferase 2 [Ulvibacter sp. MAR_2010_11]
MISIVIPVLNEEATIGALLLYLQKNSTPNFVTEILVVDGGSTDTTPKVIADISEKTEITIQFIASDKGRAIQMNTGARHASGSILYFLHADSFPPKHFDKHIVEKVKKGDTTGCFRMKFDTKHPLLQISQWFTRFNLKVCRGGDQSLFITKELFQSLGGFNETYTIYEDCEFINRLYSTTRFTVIPEYITTSSRKYRERGTWALQFHFMMIHLKNRMGASPEALYSYYLNHISRPEI